MTNRVLSMLGLAAKGGKVASGEFSTEKAIKEFKAYLVIVATDSSDNTKKSFRDACTFYEVEYREYADKETLGHAIGKEMRASVAITDEGFAKAILKKMENVM